MAKKHAKHCVIRQRVFGGGSTTLAIVLWLDATRGAGQSCRSNSSSLISINGPAEYQKQFADQVFLLHPDTVAVIRRMLLPKRTLVFDFAQSQGTLSDHFRRLVRDAGLRSTHKDGFHKLRRTALTLAESVQPGAATRLAGHSSPELTRKHYLDPRQLKQAEVVDLIPRPVIDGQEEVESESKSRPSEQTV